ncbi:MAG: thioredoxin family protein [Erysipelotrichaceae bacterium]|nr:thioredoxin family protein [Erysipelotrichaceae bacterium]
MVKKLNYKEFDEAIAHGDWILDFYTDHCGPCKMLDATMAKVLKDNPIVSLAKCNIEDDPEYQERFEVTGTPLVLFYHDGVEKARFSGAYGEDKIRECLSVCLYD